MSIQQKNKIHLNEPQEIFAVNVTRFLHINHPIIHTRTNTVEQPHQWSPYDEVFSKKGNLSINTRKQTGENPCQCSHCSNAFLKSSNLFVHTVTHIGNKLYQCSQCKNTFSTNRSTIYTYRKSHWRKTTSMQLVSQGLLN